MRRLLSIDGDGSLVSSPMAHFSFRIDKKGRHSGLPASQRLREPVDCGVMSGNYWASAVAAPTSVPVVIAKPTFRSNVSSSQSTVGPGTGEAWPVLPFSNRTAELVARAEQTQYLAGADTTASMTDHEHTVSNADHDDRRLAIDVAETAPNDEQTTITVTGAQPGAAVDVSAELTDDDGVTWRSTLAFTADERGTVDLTAQAPDSGTYEGIEPMGWLWGMQPDEDDAMLPALRSRAYTVDLRAESDGHVATATHTRVRWAEGITSSDVNRDGVVGTLYEPPGDEPFPAVVDLHGSGGRRSDDGARRLASQGFATLALEYFGDHDALPDELATIPLSYVDEAAAWLLARDAVAGEQVGVVGESRGAELALLLGARRDWVGAVVSYAGSVPWDTPTGEPAWLDDGDPVPHLTAEKAPRFADLDEKPVADVVPAVERTDGPVLLVSGGADPVWNARRLSEAVAEHLRDREFSHQFAHRTYDEVGHLIGTPYLPLGGIGDPATQRATAQAGEAVWPTAIEYLETGLEG
jgi:dienelactone hydrolase